LVDEPVAFFGAKLILPPGGFGGCIEVTVIAFEVATLREV
jgi:hypothetical protein